MHVDRQVKPEQRKTRTKRGPVCCDAQLAAAAPIKEAIADPTQLRSRNFANIAELARSLL